MQGNTRNILIALGLIIIIGAGVVIATILVRNQQLLRREAAVPEGTTEVRLSPETGNITVGDTLPVDILFNTSGLPISAITIQLDYSYTGDEPPIVIEEPIIFNNAFVTSADWSFPIKSFTYSNGSARLRIAGINTSFAGFSNNSFTKIATINLKANRVGSMTLNFDSTQSKITSKESAEDILLIPTSIGTYNAVDSGGGGNANPTSTPTTTLTPTTAAGSGNGNGGGTTGTVTVTPTPLEELPDTGLSAPTMIGLSAGLLFTLSMIGLAL